MKEADVQRRILGYLTLKGIFHYSSNSGAFKRERALLFFVGGTWFGTGSRLRRDICEAFKVPLVRLVRGLDQ